MNRKIAINILRIFILLVSGVIASSNAFAFEFSTPECEFKVEFPFRPNVKKVVQPLGDGVYSNTYMAQAIGDRQSYSAQCDTSFQLLINITMDQKRKMAEWSIDQWSKMIGLESMRMYWEEQNGQATLRMIGQRVLVEAGTKNKAAFQARVYLGKVSTMMVVVGEPAEYSPSANMYDFLNNSVTSSR